MTDEKPARFVLSATEPLPQEARTALDAALGRTLRIVHDAIAGGAHPHELMYLLMDHTEQMAPTQLRPMMAWMLIKLTLRDHPHLATGEWE